jgi:hypothetical protein
MRHLRPTPGKFPNKARVSVAEEMEGRGLAKGNLSQQNAIRTQSRVVAPSELAQVRQTAKSNKDARFTALMHHIYRIDTLRFAYSQLKRHAAAGVDGETWRHYGEALEENLQNLSHRLKRGAYVVSGHIRYFGVPGNRYALAHFRFTVSHLWHHALERRSQKGRVQWERMQRLIRRWLPRAHICHPYPSRRLSVTT